MSELNLWCPHCGAKNSLAPDGSRLDPRDGIRKKKFKCGECERTTQNPLDYDPRTNVFDQFSRPLPESKRYVITSAQNATKLHRPFFDALVQYCAANNAALIIVPYRYKNPTSTWTDAARADDWWHEEIVPYLFVDRVDINENLQLLADIRTQPTAEKPLTGFETITGHKSGILAHPKLQLVSVATPANNLPKIMTTTGSVTQPNNYTPTKAGKKGQFHHTLGACVVEVKDKKVFHLRQINALKNGSFIDLDKKYTRDGVEDAPPAAALVMGDTHVQFADPDVVRATYGKHKGSMVSTLKPKQLVYHDVLDFYSQNHWDAKNPFIKYGKHKAGLDKVPDEIELTCKFIEDNTPAGVKAVLVPSNHNEGLERWIREHNWKDDPSHMEFYLETALEMVRGTEMQDHGVTTIDPFHYWAKKLIKNTDVVYMERDESYSIQGIECGFHGDQGPNGAKGSAESFKRIGVKTIIGHFHRPEIAEGCYQVGTNSRLQLQYNTGPSAWLHTNCVIYANGKRSLLTVVEGEWKL